MVYRSNQPDPWHFGPYWNYLYRPKPILTCEATLPIHLATSTHELSVMCVWLIYLFCFVICKSYRLCTLKIGLISHLLIWLYSICAAVILPSLRRLHYDLVELDNGRREESSELAISSQMKIEKKDSFTNIDLEREDECGICLEPCTKIVLPNCCHAMCINCYRDW